jgi:succinate dehydrogenase / fumarate reductase flavoprotein subunit
VDEQFLKTTIATYDPKTESPVLSYEDVPQPMVKPRPRTYGKVDG